MYAGTARAVGRVGIAGVRYSGAERRAMPLPRCHFPHVLSAVGGGLSSMLDGSRACCLRFLKVKENGRGLEGAVPAAAAVETQ